MKMMRSAAIAIAVFVCAGLAVMGMPSDASIFDNAACGGFKPETRMLCWGSQV